MSFETLLIEQNDGVVTITINRPPVNALNTTVRDELGTAFETLEQDASARVVILTGNGGRAFAAGADIKEIDALSGADAEAMVQGWHRVCTGMESSRLPIIAAVNGVALGGGCELIMACDIRIAADHAVFGQPEINLGIIPGAGGTQRLPRLIGRGRALELIMSGDSISAQEAHRIGLANQVVPADELMDTAQKLARKIAEKSAVALRLIKECVNAGLDRPLDTGLAFEAGKFGAVCSSEDKAEGIAAFLEKRKPVFTGR